MAFKEVVEDTFIRARRDAPALAEWAEAAFCEIRRTGDPDVVRLYREGAAVYELRCTEAGHTVHVVSGGEAGEALRDAGDLLVALMDVLVNEGVL